MKRKKALLLAVLMALLAACGPASGSALPPAAEPTSSQSTGTSEHKEVEIRELYSEDGRATNSDGLEFDYVYHVPQIADDTPDALYLNEEIKAVYGFLAERGMESIKNKELPDCPLVNYESHRSGTVLSLIVQYVSYYGGYKEYDVYNYDVEKGEALSNADLLALQGVTEEQYLRAARRAAASCYDNLHFTDDMDPMFDYGITVGDLNECRGWTLSSENITPDLPTYLDDTGKLHIVAAIGTLAETEYRYYLLPLEMPAPTAPLTAAYSDFLTATLQDGELSLTFTDTPKARELRSDSYPDYAPPPYGTAIPVHGCFSDYTDMVFLSTSEQTLPILFLLTREGRVEYVPLEIDFMADYYCVIGPLPYTNHAASFSAGTAVTGDSTYFVTLEGGERYNLQMDLMGESNSLSDCYKASWSAYVTHSYDDGSGYEVFYSLEINDWFDVSLTAVMFDGDFVSTDSGTLNYMGISEDGMVYACNLSGDGPDETSAIALRNVHIADENAEYGYVNTLLVTELGGDGLIYIEPGTSTEFVVGVG